MIHNYLHEFEERLNLENTNKINLHRRDSRSISNAIRPETRKPSSSQSNRNR